MAHSSSAVRRKDMSNQSQLTGMEPGSASSYQHLTCGLVLFCCLGILWRLWVQIKCHKSATRVILCCCWRNLDSPLLRFIEEDTAARSQRTACLGEPREPSLDSIGFASPGFGPQLSLECYKYQPLRTCWFLGLGTGGWVRQTGSTLNIPFWTGIYKYGLPGDQTYKRQWGFSTMWET